MARKLADVGVSSAIKDDDVAAMGGPAAQDRFIAEVAVDLADRLGKMVGRARPRSDFHFTVTGPHSDPLLGLHHVHTLVAKFDVDELPAGCDALRLLRDTPETDPQAHLAIQPEARQAKP